MIDPTTFEDKKAAFYTLGCKLNFAETSTIGRSLAQMGVRKVRTGESADICIVNTCSVTELADKKCRTAIRRIHREHPDAYLIVTGCYAQLKPEEVAGIDGVDLVLGAAQKLDLIQFIEDLSKQKDSARVVCGKASDIRVFSPSCSSDDRTRHFLKVQDGCDYYCTYCTIPAARGRSRNGSIDSIVLQAQSVAAQGGKEIVLTGVNIGDFGRTTGETLIGLLQALDEVDGIERYRISSIEPNLLTDEIIDFIAQSRRFTPHFHLPLQSGSDQVLRLMRRRYDTTLFSERVEHIRSVLPEAFIGVDVIVGSRGEEAHFFEETFDFLSKLPFSALHVFTYSERAGTSALNIPHIVEAKEKHRRSERLLILSEEKLRAFTCQGVGKSYRVLWESGVNMECKDGEIAPPAFERMEGYTENYLRISAPYSSDALGVVQTVEAVAFDTLSGCLQIDDLPR